MIITKPYMSAKSNLFLLLALFLAMYNYAIANEDDSQIIQTADSYYVKKQFKKAYETIKPIAEKGNAEAEGKLGSLLVWGQGVQKNTEKGITLIKSAANKGYHRAQHIMCILKIQGKLVERNMEHAFNWCKKAADNGNAIAMSDLGTFYIRGEYVDRNPKLAHELWVKAADAGDARAHLRIAKMLDKGDLGIKDPMGALGRRMSAKLSLNDYCGQPEWSCAKADPLTSCNTKELLLQVKKDINLNKKSMTGHTALHCSAVKGDLNLVKILLKKSVNVNETNANKVTPLHLAAMYAHPEIVAILLKNGAKVNVRARNGNIPLHAAVSGGNSIIVKALLENNADVNAIGQRDRTALDLAMEGVTNNMKIYQPRTHLSALLKKFGAKCNSIVPCKPNPKFKDAVTIEK